MFEDQLLLDKFTRTYEAGATIFSEAEPGFEMYIIKSGRVKVFKAIASGEKMLSMLGPGSLFGEMSLIEAKPRSATVVTMEKTEVLVVTYTDLEQILSLKTEFLYKLIQVFCKRIRFTSCQVENFSIKSVPARIANLLIILAENTSSNSAEDKPIKLGVGIAEVSQMTGLEFSEVHTNVLKLVQDGQIIIGGDQTISIANLDALKSFRNFNLSKGNLENIR